MKVAYSRAIGDCEIVLMCGYVGEGKCVVIVKDNIDNDIIKEYGILPQDKAFEIYNNETENDILLVELYNFIDDLTMGGHDFSDDYIRYKAKRLLPVLKSMRKDLK